mgnify:CR=1 FL=1
MMKAKCINCIIASIATNIKRMSTFITIYGPVLKVHCSVCEGVWVPNKSDQSRWNYSTSTNTENVV